MVKMMSNTTGEDWQIGQPQLDWSSETIGEVESSFFWGFLITQIPAGFLSSHFPATRLFGLAIFASSCLNLCMPAATKLSPGAAAVVRLCQGMMEGIAMPSSHGIFRDWIPPLERSRLVTLACFGFYGGPVFGMPLSGRD